MGIINIYPRVIWIVCEHKRVFGKWDVVDSIYLHSIEKKQVFEPIVKEKLPLTLFNEPVEVLVCI